MTSSSSARFAKIFLNKKAELQDLFLLPEKMKLLRAQAIHARLSELETCYELDDRVEQFVLLKFILTDHQRHGGLKDRQVVHFLEQAHVCLQLLGIKPKQSRFAYLYGELATIHSQIQRSSGQHWNSAWSQASANLFEAKQEHLVQDFTRLSTAERFLRLGDAAKALSLIAPIDHHGKDKRTRERPRLARLKCLRLMHDLEQARTLHSETMSDCWSTGGKLELVWERLCLDALEQDNLHPLLSATRRKAQHYHATYCVDIWLWATARGKKEYRERLPTIRYLMRKKSGLDVGPQRVAYDCALAIENLFDETTPLALRLMTLGDALAKAPSIEAIDKEMLVWSAAATVLRELRAEQHACLATAKYEGLSRMLSVSKTSDAFHLHSCRKKRFPLLIPQKLS